MIVREVTKYSRTTDRLLGGYPIACSADDMRHLFDVGDDHDMVFIYDINTPEQIAFFKKLGVPITNRCDWFVECFEQ